MAYEDKDPRTVEALEKIKAILVEYDLFAAFTVVSVERVHWMWHVDPSWSCLSIDAATGHARVRAKVADFVTKEQHQRVVNLTTGAIASCRDRGGAQQDAFAQLYGVLEKHFDGIEHTYSDPELKRV